MQVTQHETQVLIIGGGTAGFGAAISAARAGRRVTLIEASGKIGGVMANCPGMPWGGGFPCDAPIGGLMFELFNRLTAMSPPMAQKRPCTLHNFGPEIIYDHEAATLTMYQMLQEAGVDLRLNTFALMPELEGNRIKAVTICDRLGLTRIQADIVLDCSGDGDISAKAGVPYRLGDATGNMMGVTLTFMMVGADWDRVFAHDDPYFTQDAAKGIADGRLHPDLGQLYLMRGYHPGTVFFNSVIIRNVDGTDPQAIQAATQEGRRRCHALARFAIAEIDGFQDAIMVALGPQVGVRETRKLEGQITISGSDIHKAEKYADGIVCCDNPIDDVMRGAGEMTHDAAVAQGAYYRIPLRALVPKTITNLAFAGRILSADDTAFASVRGMPQCMTMGQAVGTLADLALSDNATVQNVPASKVIARLQDQGVRGLANDPLVPL